MSVSLPKQKKLIPISEAAKILSVSIDTIRRWDKSGVLHSERPDGKNRYFSLDELEKHKFHQPFSISEVAKKLGISATTLRRLETRGLIRPKRNNAGERVYDKDLLKNFLNSDYSLRKKQIKEKIFESFQEEKGLIDDFTLEDETEHLERRNSASNQDLRTDPDLKIRSRMPEFMITSTVIFLLLTALGVRNIHVSVAKNYQPSPSPAVLAEIKEATPSATPLAETQQSLPSAAPEATSAAILEATAAEMSTAPADAVKPETTLTIKIDDDSSYVNIRQKPTINSEKIGQARDGDTFTFISEESGWYEIRLADGQRGFISKKYIVTNERNN